MKSTLDNKGKIKKIPYSRKRLLENQNPSTSTVMDRPYYMNVLPAKDPMVRKAQEYSHNFLVEMQEKTHRKYYPELETADAKFMIRRATSILRARIDIVAVPTTIPELDDNVFIQGLWPYTITEFVSHPDVNKSHLCFTILTNLLCKSRDYHIVYITTKNTFSKEIVSEMVAAHGKNPETMLRRIHVYDIHNLAGLISIYNVMKVHHLDTHKLGLVVIDGIQVFFKDTVDEVPSYMNIPIMTKFFQSIKVQSIICKFPVLVTNDLTVELVRDRVSRTPYLDERYRQFVDLRVWLQKTPPPESKWTATVITPTVK